MPIDNGIVKCGSPLVISFIQSGSYSPRQSLHVCEHSILGGEMQWSLLCFIMESELCVFTQECIHYLPRKNR